MKKRPLYCSICRETTPHVYCGRRSGFEGTGIARGILAVASLGMSETTLADHYWQCECCGEMRKS